MIRVYRFALVLPGILCLLAQVPAASALTQARITERLERLNALLAERPADQTAVITALVQPWLDNLAPLAERTFKKYYTHELDEDSRQLVCRLFGQRLASDLADAIARRGVARAHLTHFSADERKARAHLQLALAVDDHVQAVSIEWHRQDEGWALDEIQLDGEELSKHYNNAYEDILERKYSVEVLISRLRGLPYIQLEDFARGTPGSVPPDWVTWRRKDTKKPKNYYIRQDQGHYYVAAKDSGLSVILGRPLHWNPREYPILTWCWRANALPPGGNERLNHTNDSAAGIYVLFSRNLIGVPRQIKYVWSTTLPEGTIDRRNKIWRPYFFVVESGYENMGKWVFEAVNLYEAHQYAFNNDKPPNRTLAIGMLTDANSTDSYAEAYYADFRAWTMAAQEQGLIQDYCGCFSNASAQASPAQQSPTTSYKPGQESQP